MKKTNIPIYIMYLWAALVLAACTGDDDAAWPEGGVPLELYAAVEGYSSANAQTRATTENRWELAAYPHTAIFPDLLPLIKK